MSPTKKPRVKTTPPPPTEKQKKPWDSPPFPIKGDDDERNTFEWVGKALSKWEEFEAYFGLIFGVFVGANNETEPAMRAYGSILTFRGRLDMTKAAARAYFWKNPATTPAQPLFDNLVDRAEGYSGRRNEIAHGIVQLYYPDGQTVSGSALGPSRHATNKRKLVRQEGELPLKITSVYAYTSHELLLFTRDFHLLAQEARGYHRNLFHFVRERRRASP